MDGTHFVKKQKRAHQAPHGSGPSNFEASTLKYGVSGYNGMQCSLHVFTFVSWNSKWLVWYRDWRAFSCWSQRAPQHHATKEGKLHPHGHDDVLAAAS